MKQFVTYHLLLIAFCSFADMPGNKPRPDYNVMISGLQQYKEYTFYYQGYDSAAVLKDSGSINVPGGFGAPECIAFWAVQQKTDQHTDTLYFCSGEEDDDKAILIRMEQNHLSFTSDTTFLTVDKNIPLSGTLNNMQDTQSVKNRNIMYVISGLSFFVLLVLVFFVWNKNRKSKIQ